MKKITVKRVIKSYVKPDVRACEHLRLDIDIFIIVFAVFMLILCCLILFSPAALVDGAFDFEWLTTSPTPYPTFTPFATHTPYSYAGPTSTPLPPCPGLATLGPGTAWPVVDDLQSDYAQFCSHCFTTPLPTSPYSLIRPPSSTPSSGQSGTVGLTDNVLSGRVFTSADVDYWERWVLDSYVYNDLAFHYFTSWPVDAMGQSVDLGPFDGDTVGLVFDLEVDAGNLLEGQVESLYAWYTPDTLQDANGVSILSTSFYHGASYFSYDASVASTSTTSPVQVCISTVAYCAQFAPTALFVEFVPPTMYAGAAFTLGFSVAPSSTNHIYFYVSNLRLLQYGLASTPTPTPTPTKTYTPSPTYTPGTTYDVHFINYSDPTGGTENDGTMSGSLSGDNRRIDFSWTVTSASGSTNNHVYLGYYAQSGVTSFKVLITAVNDNNGSPVWEWLDTCTGDQRVYWYFIPVTTGWSQSRSYPASGQALVTYTSAGVGWNSTADLGFRACPRTRENFTISWSWEIVEINGVNISTTPTPTPTQTATVTMTPTITPTYTPTALPGSDTFCLDIQFRDKSPVADFSTGENWVSGSTCYKVLPAENIDIGEISLLGVTIFPGVDLEWDDQYLCINWVEFPSISLMGVDIELSWVLLPLLAWFIRRLLQL